MPSPSPEGLHEPQGLGEPERPGCGEAFALVPGDMPQGRRTGTSVGVEESPLSWLAEVFGTLPPFPLHGTGKVRMHRGKEEEEE